MKKRIKQTGALFLTLAMILSLSTTAFATDPEIGKDYGDQNSTVTSEGPPPADVTDVIMPTSASGQFNMYFDTFGMILETEADRYASDNIEEIEDSRFYFKNSVEATADKTDQLVGAFQETDGTWIKPATKVVKYTKAAATGGLTKIYAKPDPYGETYQWAKADGTALAAAATEWNSDYAKLASLKALDPQSGAGLDAIAALNKSTPDLYLTVGADKLTTPEDLAGCYEYTFISSYSTTADDTYYVLFNDDGTVRQVFSGLGSASAAPTAVTSATFDDFTDSTDSANNIKKAFLTDSSVVYYRQVEQRTVVSLKKTSVPLKIINKTNADLGVSVSAELTGIPGGDGTSNTYVYAKDYDADTGKFYDDVATAMTRNVIQGGPDGVPVFYLALTDGTDTEVMTYADSKGTVSIGTLLAGRPDLFKKAWDTTLGTSGGYAYVLSDPATREKDFSGKEFYFTGAIDLENPAWNTLTSPTVKVTWKLETITPPAAPTVTPPSAINARADAIFTVSNNTDDLVFLSVTQDGTEIAADKITVTNDATSGATTQVKIAKGIVTGTQDLVFTFKDQQKAFLTKSVTVSYS